MPMIYWKTGGDCRRRRCRGVDAIEFFAKRGAQVCIVERSHEIGYDVDPITRCNLMDNLKNIRWNSLPIPH